MLWQPASPSSILAAITTLHLGLAALRNHRSAEPYPVSSLTLVSLALAAAPWLFPALFGLILGVALHGCWFLACEMLVHRTGGPTLGQPVQPANLDSQARHTPAPRPQPARGFVQTPVLSTYDETTDIKTIRMLRPDGFAFEAGQFIPVRMRVDGGEYVRCYSISSSPASTGFVEISVKRQGLVSNALHATCRPGVILSIKAPNGSFRYPAHDDRPIVLLAGGVGITPLVSMLRYAVHAEPSRAVTLVYSAHTERDLAFRDELDMLMRRHGQFRVVYALTRQSAPGPAFYPGRIDAALLGTVFPPVADAISYICGPRSMIEGTRALLSELGVPAPQIRHEVFEAAVAASAGTREPSNAAGGTLPDRSAAVGAAAHDMRCQPAGTTIAVPVGQTLLEAAEAAGVDVPSLCRAGVCGTCRIRVTEGEVTCESTTLDADDREQGFVLACVAVAHSDCTVHL